MVVNNIDSALQALELVFEMTEITYYENNRVSCTHPQSWYDVHASIKFSSDWKIVVIECYEFTSPHIDSLYVFRWNARRKQYVPVEYV